MHAKKSLKSFTTLCETLWTVAHWAPLAVGFSRQEHWSALLCPLPGDRPYQGSNLRLSGLPALAGESFTTSTTWEALWNCPIAQNKTVSKRRYCFSKGAKKQRLTPPVKTFKYAGWWYFTSHAWSAKSRLPEKWLQTARHLTKF